MKRRATTAALVLMLWCGAGFAAGQESMAADETPEAAVTRLKRELVKAYLERDGAALERIYCDDYTATDAQGKARTKADELAGLKDTSSRLLSGTYDPIAVRVFGDVAVLYGRGDLKGEGKSGPYHHRYESFNVFQRRAGRWCYAAAYLP